VSQENVELVRRLNECWSRQDWEGVAELCAPDIEQHGTVGGIDEGRVLVGASEIRRDYENVDATWDEHWIEPQEFIDAGDRVVVLLREFQRGKKSGIELEIDTALVVDVCDGRVTRVQGYMDRAAALEAAGLSE
jgi:ketosteroid isomerase-like protein